METLRVAISTVNLCSVGSIYPSASLWLGLFHANQVFRPQLPSLHSVFILVTYTQPSSERPVGHLHQSGESAHGFGTCFKMVCDSKLFDVVFV